jgi:hypothetical protein
MLYTLPVNETYRGLTKEGAMSCLTLNEMMTADLYLAGERVPAGTYREVDTGREIRLEREDYLPASLDGRVAAYACLLYTWSQTQPSTQMPEKAHR